MLVDRTGLVRILDELGAERLIEWVPARPGGLEVLTPVATLGEEGIDSWHTFP